MASRKPGDLAPGVAAAANAFEVLCDREGIDLLIYCTYRSAEEQAKVINEVTIRYVDSDGEQNSVTVRDQESINKYGIRRYGLDMNSSVSQALAEQRALDILNAN